MRQNNDDDMMMLQRDGTHSCRASVGGWLFSEMARTQACAWGSGVTQKVRGRYKYTAGGKDLW